MGMIVSEDPSKARSPLSDILERAQVAVQTKTDNTTIVGGAHLSLFRAVDASEGYFRGQ